MLNFTQWQVPNFLEGVSIPAYMWKEEKHIKECTADTWGVTPTSLGWGHNIRLGM